MPVRQLFRLDAPAVGPLEPAVPVSLVPGRAGGGRCLTLPWPVAEAGLLEPSVPLRLGKALGMWRESGS